MQFLRQRPVPRRADGRHPGDTRQRAGQRSIAEAGQADAREEPPEPDDRARGLRQFGILALVVGVVLSVVYSLQSWNLSDIASDVAVAIAVSGASLFLGLLIGFLFGIPRPLSSPDAGLMTAERSETEPARDSGDLPIYEQNTNLVEISDWLTKILVGVGLIQIASFPEKLAALGRFLGPGMAGQSPANQVFAVVLFLYFLVAGFLLGYLFTRLFLPSALRRADISALRGQLARFERRVEQQLTQLAEEIHFRDSPALRPDIREKVRSSLTSYQQYLRNLGYEPGAGQVNVEVGPNAGQNAYYNADGNRIVLGPALAEDTDVALREYTHHVLASFSREPFGNWDPVYRAIESGLADYFPCSFEDDPLVAEVWARSSWNRPYIRNLENERKFPETAPDAPEQDVGEIWGAIFWEIRKLLGQPEADQLCLSAWSSLQPSDLRANTPARFVQRLVEGVPNVHEKNTAREIETIIKRRGLEL